MKVRGIPHELALPGAATAEYVRTIVLPAAMALLPEKMDTGWARVLLMAIGFQESDFRFRRQHGGGPALSFWQAEPTGGFRGVLQHTATRDLARSILGKMAYDELDFAAVEHNDILACAFARLLLWTHPKPLPTNERAGWDYYLATWRPGKPHPDRWGKSWARAAEPDA